MAFLLASPLAGIERWPGADLLVTFLRCVEGAVLLLNLAGSLAS